LALSKIARPVLVLILGSVTQPVSAQISRTVLDGVFTGAQAKRGEAAYGVNCTECHDGADVDGPTLEGTPFIDRWREDNLDILFTFLSTKMPADKPGKLSESTYLDILAYLLEMNKYRGGTQELTVDALGTTRLVGPDGPKPLPTNSLIEAVGCLASGPDGAWTLVNATEPSRTLVADQITAQEQKIAAAKPLGSQTFRLQNLADVSGLTPNSYRGHKVLTKGVVIRQVNNDRINVTALTTIGSSCAP
jgi:quinoprotein glucose dehydrogenase